MCAKKLVPISLSREYQHFIMAYNSTATTNSNRIIPFFVLHLSDDKVKALFRVPSNMAETLVGYPILCRGASFDLIIDVISQSRETATAGQNSRTTFLSTEFCSPDPEETARAIAERIAIRQEFPSPNVSNLFG
mmetsp:Transcript_18389/g.37629  ORF Transcript_18389/g.37629 Transcript_18389/m.37629 type:complete len:134 (-) Transcript_18389:503-904(-)